MAVIVDFFFFFFSLWWWRWRWWWSWSLSTQIIINKDTNDDSNLSGNKHTGIGTQSCFAADSTKQRVWEKLYNTNLLSPSPVHVGKSARIDYIVSVHVSCRLYHRSLGHSLIVFVNIQHTNTHTHTPAMI